MFNSNYNVAKHCNHTKIFRTIGCIGDSLSSGEFQTYIDGVTDWHDMYEYSWGQFIARETGAKVYNFSKGGMSCKWYLDSFASENNFFDKEKACQAYIIALGVNDLICQKQALGDISDIDVKDYKNNKNSFIGLYATIIQKYKQIEPNAKFFLVSMPKDNYKEHNEISKKFAKLLYEVASLFSNTYVIDLYKYSKKHDKKFKGKYYLLGHMNPMGYEYTAVLIMHLIDKIIKRNMQDFSQVGLIGTKWYMNYLDKQ